ncbi:MAG: hypothetical protein WBW70_05215 [Candidatus Sulfotelmatobacter sp.]|jgi:hypothetical protein
MNQKTRFRFLPLLLVAALFVFTSACQKRKPPTEEEEVLPMDRVAPSPAASTQTVLHKTFSVNTSTTFRFEIPAHAAMPHLRGNYKSFVNQLGAQASDDSANVDFLLLNEDQYADFVHGHAGEALFSADASHDQEVNVSLPPSQDQPEKYYLVFRNSTGGVAKKLVQADFTLDF